VSDFRKFKCTTHKFFRECVVSHTLFECVGNATWGLKCVQKMSALPKTAALVKVIAVKVFNNLCNSVPSRSWYHITFESPCVLLLYVCVLQAVVAKSFLRNIPTGWLPCFGCPVEMIPIEGQQRKEKRVGTMTYRSESCLYVCMHWLCCS